MLCITDINHLVSTLKLTGFSIYKNNLTFTLLSKSEMCQTSLVEGIQKKCRPSKLLLIYNKVKMFLLWIESKITCFKNTGKETKMWVLLYVGGGVQLFFLVIRWWWISSSPPRSALVLVVFVIILFFFLLFFLLPRQIRASFLLFKWNDTSVLNNVLFLYVV